MAFPNDNVNTRPEKQKQKIPQTQTFTTPKEIESSSRLDTTLTQRDEALFLMWHTKLGHKPFRNVCWAAKLGLLPRKRQQCWNIVCPACLYSKQRKRPWRYKGKEYLQHHIKKCTKPGKCVSVDQLISSTPGLVGQTTGKMTMFIQELNNKKKSLKFKCSPLQTTSHHLQCLTLH